MGIPREKYAGLKAFPGIIIALSEIVISLTKSVLA